MDLLHPARGEGRTSLDTDLLARVPAALVDRLAKDLRDHWYRDPESARESIREARSFNIINKLTGEKFDVFLAAGAFHGDFGDGAWKATDRSASPDATQYPG